MFFILRAGKQTGKRWSGQVGFPGGHVEEGESDVEALARECKEEVGLNVQEPGYQWLGEIKRRAFDNGDKRLVVCCHVFEQCVREEPEHLQTSEVAAAGWAPLMCLTGDQDVSPLDWTDQDGKRTLWCGWPAVRLPISDQDMWLSEKQVLTHTKEETRARFQLWGLTLSLVNDLLLECRLRETKIDHLLLEAKGLILTDEGEASLGSKSRL